MDFKRFAHLMDGHGKCCQRFLGQRWKISSSTKTGDPKTYQAASSSSLTTPSVNVDLKLRDLSQPATSTTNKDELEPSAALSNSNATASMDAVDMDCEDPLPAIELSISVDPESLQSELLPVPPTSSTPGAISMSSVDTVDSGPMQVSHGVMSGSPTASRYGLDLAQALAIVRSLPDRLELEDFDTFFFECLKQD